MPALTATAGTAAPAPAPAPRTHSGGELARNSADRARMTIRPGTMNAAPPISAPSRPRSRQAQKMASWVEAGPGSRLQAAMASSNSRRVQPALALARTAARSSLMCAGGPPNPMQPIRPHSRSTVPQRHARRRAVQQQRPELPAPRDRHPGIAHHRSPAGRAARLASRYLNPGFQLGRQLPARPDPRGSRHGGRRKPATAALYAVHRSGSTHDAGVHGAWSRAGSSGAAGPFCTAASAGMVLRGAPLPRIDRQTTSSCVAALSLLSFHACRS